jgi:SAM-dependent methyltransferase
MLKRLLASFTGSKHSPEAAALEDRDALPRSATNARVAQVNLQAMPDIFHYWYSKHFCPAGASLGFFSPNDFFCKWTARHCAQNSGRPVRALSLGATRVDLETEIAVYCRDEGHTNLSIECASMPGDRRSLSFERAKRSGVDEIIRPLPNPEALWQQDHAYDIIMTNNVLNDAEQTELLLDKIVEHLAADGIFLISDKLPDNARTPAALREINHLWQTLDEHYRYNHLLEQVDERFAYQGELDDSVTRDFLSLLDQRFQFETFAGFANIIEPFISRAYGHNFDTKNPDDLAFIDRVHAADVQLMREGTIKPTYLLACLQKQATLELHFPGLSSSHVLQPEPR